MVTVWMVLGEISLYEELRNAEQRAREVGSLVEAISIDDDEYEDRYQKKEFADM